jgi:ATP-binding cassette subfamily C protein EexD
MINNSGESRELFLEAFYSLKGYFLYATIFSAAINLLMLTPILYMLLVYDRVVSSGSMETLVMLTILMTMLLMFSGSFEWARSRLLVAANVKLEESLRSAISKASFRNVLLSGNSEGSSLPMNDLLALRQFVTGNGIFAIMDAPWTPIYIGVMFLFHWLFGVAAIIAALILITLAIVTQKTTAGKLSTANIFTQKAALSFNSKLRNSEVIHGMGMGSRIEGKSDQLYQEAANEQAHASAAAGRLSAISKSFRQISQSLLLGLGAYLVLTQAISPGVMIAGSLLLGRALAPIDIMVGSWKGFIDARIQVSRIRQILRIQPEELKKLPLPAPFGQISLDQVTVAPPGSRVASVRGLSFSLSAGESLGIIGPSAAGKTSLARAILGVWPLAAGTVRIDGAEIGQWDRDKLGPYLGYLPQDIELFDGSIAENICRFSEPNSDKIIDASKSAGIHEMILQLPNGYDTPIGATSGLLSAGQRQRVGLARAIYDNPKIILLDEPNSNLDEQGERDLLSALRRMKELGSTTLVITHRTSILSLVDKLLVLKNGMAVKFGDRDSVLKELSAESAKVTQLQKKS